jgi:hypothetical protein
MADSQRGRGGMIGQVRDKLQARRQRRAEKAHLDGAAKREWERSGQVGRYGQHEGYSSGS